MLGEHIHMLCVTVPVAIRAHRADTTWFDRYCFDPNPIHIQNNWRSVPADADEATWEFLVDEVIELDDHAGLAHLKQFGAHLRIDQRRTTSQG